MNTPKNPNDHQKGEQLLARIGIDTTNLSSVHREELERIGHICEPIIKSIQEERLLIAGNQLIDAVEDGVFDEVHISEDPEQEVVDTEKSRTVVIALGAIMQGYEKRLGHLEKVQQPSWGEEAKRQVGEEIDVNFRELHDLTERMEKAEKRLRAHAEKIEQQETLTATIMSICKGLVETVSKVEQQANKDNIIAPEIEIKAQIPFTGLSAGLSFDIGNAISKLWPWSKKKKEKAAVKQQISDIREKVRDVAVEAQQAREVNTKPPKDKIEEVEKSSDPIETPTPLKEISEEDEAIFEEIRMGNYYNTNKLSCITPEVVDYLDNVQYSDIELNGLANLTVEAAEVLVGLNKSLQLNGLANLTVEVAEVLSKLTRKLQLNGLTTITPEVAKILTRYGLHGDKLQSLQLNGLTTITPEVAESLSGRLKRESLQLYGITTLTPEVAKILAPYNRESLQAEKFTNLDEEVASIISFGFHGHVKLNTLTTITPEVARAVNKDEIKSIELNGLTDITPEVAKILTNSNKLKSLQLNGLTDITPEVAKILAEKKCELCLNGLTQISVDVARHLAKQRDRLELNGLTQISVDVARHLAKHFTCLELNGLTDLTPEVTQILAKKGMELNIHVGAKTLTPEVVKAIEATGRVKISSNSLENVTPELVKTIESIRCAECYKVPSSWGEKLYLNGLTDLTPEIASVITTDTIELNGLTDLTPEVAKILTNSNKLKSLQLNGLTDITPEVAKILAEKKCELHLNSLVEITPEVAKILASAGKIKVNKRNEIYINYQRNVK